MNGIIGVWSGPKACEDKTVSMASSALTKVLICLTVSTQTCFSLMIPSSSGNITCCHLTGCNDCKDIGVARGLCGAPRTLKLH